jgi:hypothetical protein
MVQNKRGSVKSAKFAKDQHGDWICLHVICFDEKATRKLKHGGEMGSVWEKIKEEVHAVNYAFIYPIA